MIAETQIDFAARLGVSRSYITQLKQADRLVMTAAGLVDVEASLARIKATEDPSKARKAPHTTPVRENAPRAPIAATTAAPTTTPKNEEEETPDYQKARARKEEALANMAEMESKKMAGDLISREAAEFASSDLAAGVRSNLENIPARWAPVLAPITDLNQMQATLTEIIENTLLSLSNQRKKRASELHGQKQ